MHSANIFVICRALFFTVVVIAGTVISLNADSSQTLVLSPDSIPFAPAVNYSAGGCPTSVFCADLDGDSDIDLAVTNPWIDMVSILKNNGDGTFYLDSNYQVGGGPWTVLCADLDGDSDFDLAVSNIYSTTVSILKNNGDGTFQTKVDYGTGSYPYRLSFADLDGDYDLDLAVANYYTTRVSILKNNGDGTFQGAVDYNVGVYPTSAFCVDLDGDSYLDIAVANASSNNVSILKNKGDGTFDTAVNYGGGDGPTRIFCADLNGDKDLDLAISNCGSDNVSILLNLSNPPPDYFSLLSPTDSSFIFCFPFFPFPFDACDVTFDWENASEPNPWDTVRYDLYVSTSSVFHPDSVVIHDSLMSSQYTDTLNLGRYFWTVRAYDIQAEVWSDDTLSLYFFEIGDVNCDGEVTLLDVVIMINYLFKGGEPPCGIGAGDVNCDGKITVSDVIYLINYLFKGGPPPAC